MEHPESIPLQGLITLVRRIVEADSLTNLYIVRSAMHFKQRSTLCLLILASKP